MIKCRRLTVGTKYCGFQELSIPIWGSAEHDSRFCQRAENGVHILENLDTAQLVRDGVAEFMFTLGQPRYRGAVQAIINPVAIR